MGDRHYSIIQPNIFLKNGKISRDALSFVLLGSSIISLYIKIKFKYIYLLSLLSIIITSIIILRFITIFYNNTGTNIGRLISYQ